MTFGPQAGELEPGAGIAVDVGLSINPEEPVGLIADEPSREVAASIAAALDRIGATWNAVLIEDAARPLTSAPQPVLDALEHADVGILCVQPQPGELGARMTIVSVVERRGIRYAHMVGVTPQIMREGMRADYRLVDALSQRVCERMRHARRLRVETPSGTSFTASFDPSLAWVKTSGLSDRRDLSNMPAGGGVKKTPSAEGGFLWGRTAGGLFWAQ